MCVTCVPLTPPLCFFGSVNITSSPFNYNPQGTNYWLGCASLWKNFPFSTLSLTLKPHIIFPYSFYPGEGGTHRLTPQRQAITPYLVFIWMLYRGTQLVMTHSCWDVLPIERKLIFFLTAHRYRLLSKALFVCSSQARQWHLPEAAGQNWCSHTNFSLMPSISDRKDSVSLKLQCLHVACGRKNNTMDMLKIVALFACHKKGVVPSLSKST